IFPATSPSRASLLPPFVMGRIAKRRVRLTPRALARRKVLEAKHGDSERENRRPVPLPARNALAQSGQHIDPALEAQVEETLSCLTLKRRRFLKAYIESGNQRRAVLAAGYDCKTPQTASAVAKEILADPYVQHAYQALLEARGLSGAKLDAIHALHLARHSSPDGGDRDRSLRALALARKYL